MKDKLLPKKMWAGFISGLIDLDHYHEPGSLPYGILYKTRKAARTRYQDVRRVEVREVKRK